MTKLFALLLLLSCFSVFASVELKSHMLKQDCVISNNKVTVIQSFDVKDQLLVKTTSEIQISGLDDIAKVAALSSSGVQADENEYLVVLDGKKFSLNTRDSAESKTLVRMIVKLCNL